MVEKEDLLKYLVVGLICSGLVGLLLILRIEMTGYAVYSEGPGEGQTTLMLQTADSDNLGDAYVDSGSGQKNKNRGVDTELKVRNSDYHRIYIKFNISGIPENQIIDNASLCLYLYDDRGVQTISINHVYIHDWNEGSLDGGDASGQDYTTNITWNNQPCGTNKPFDNDTNCNLTVESSLSNDANQDGTWQCWSVTNMVYSEYNSGDKNVSAVLHTDDGNVADFFYSKEYGGDIDLRPYLNITYHTANTIPSVNLVSPQDEATYGYNESLALDFSAFDSDENLDSCWYNIGSGNNISLPGCANITFDVSGNGDYVLNIYANDTVGEEAFDSASFSVQVGAPTIVLNFPIDEYLNYQENIQFNYTPTDVDLDSCELWGDFNGNFSLNQADDSPTNGSVNSFYLNLSDGEYLWNIKCNDTVNNSAFNGNKTFYVDIINPNVSLSEPSGAKTSRTVSSSWSVFDTNPVSCLYNVYRGESLEIGNTSVSCSTNSVNFDVTIDASFAFNFYVNDSAGNSNSANSSFSVDTSSGGTTVIVGGGGGGGGSSRTTVIISNNTKKIDLQVSKIGEVVAKAGDKKTLSLNVKNTGDVFLNNCKLIMLGGVSSWIYSNKVSGIAPGETIDFAFDLNVPEEIEFEDYSGKLTIDCNEKSKTQDVVVSIPRKFELIEIKDIEQEGDVLRVIYNLNNSNLIGETVSLDIWIVSEDGVEINRVRDIVEINKDGVIESDVDIELSEDLAGIYYVYFALSSDLDDFTRQSVVLRRSGIIGFVIFDTFRGKMIVYIIFLLMIGVGIFFIWKRHGKAKHGKSKWFFGKFRKKG